MEHRQPDRGASFGDLSEVELRFLASILERVRSLDNALRGAYAEALVASHLPGAITNVGWAGWDVDWEGIRIEVKTSGLHQSWHKPDQGPSVPRWSVPERYAWDPANETFSEEQRRHADVYVFCLHRGRELAEDWGFYVVPTSALDTLGAKSVGLAALEQIAGGATPAEDLAQAVLAVARSTHRR